MAQFRGSNALPSVPPLLPYLNIQALDFLIQGAERDVELLGGVSLVAVAALQFLCDDAALDIFENVEEGGVGVVFQQRILEAAAGDVAGEQACIDDWGA